jgi:hypothetical protein
MSTEEQQQQKLVTIQKELIKHAQSNPVLKGVLKATQKPKTTFSPERSRYLSQPKILNQPISPLSE